ncbi:DUF2521 family protein [Mesorhizobium newzealandense]|uniref:DUF2521 family protein n=1 Tax=Mesorhizobium newzealandense TaxID=1300302 RepID=A0ABW4UG54_9HYPH
MSLSSLQEKQKEKQLKYERKMLQGIIIKNIAVQIFVMPFKCKSLHRQYEITVLN